MAVKLRLTRLGNTNRPFFRIIAADSRMRRDGRHLDILGHYDPTAEPIRLHVSEDNTLAWLRKGAQPTDTVRSLLRTVGVWQKFQQEKTARKTALKAARAAKKSDQPQPTAEPEQPMIESPETDSVLSGEATAPAEA